MPGLPVHHQLPEFTQTHSIELVMPSIHPSHRLSSPSSPALNLSHQGLFNWVSSSHQVAKVLEFQHPHQSFHEHPGQISFRMDWLDVLGVQGTLKSPLQHHNSKASVLQLSAFFLFFFLFIFMSWRLITLQYWSGFCHTLTCFLYSPNSYIHIWPLEKP